MKITKSQLNKIIREEIQNLKERIGRPERGDIGFVKKYNSIATIYDVMDGGKKLNVKLGKTGKKVVISPEDIQIVPD